LDNLIIYFSKLGYSENDIAEFTGSLLQRNFKAGDLIIAKEQTENYLSFIDMGIIRYFLEGDNKEITFDFAFKNSFFCAYDSFYSRKPTTIYIEALTDCALYSISYDNLQKLYQKCETAQKIGRTATEYLLGRKVKRELDLLTKTPQRRYEELLLDHPKYIKEIPLKFLASYLGIVPETLSRIRKRIS
jgi:CRP-like cAMP-binding protein